MPFRGTNATGGKKGRSGRKTLQEEMAKRYAIEKAWNKVNNEIDNEPVEKIALPIALKTMTDKKEITGNITINFDDAFNLTSKTAGGGC